MRLEESSRADTEIARPQLAVGVFCGWWDTPPKLPSFVYLRRGGTLGVSQDLLVQAVSTQVPQSLRSHRIDAWQCFGGFYSDVIAGQRRLLKLAQIGNS